jgi:hypothetical protein
MEKFRHVAGQVLRVAIRKKMTRNSDGEIRRGGWLYLLEDWSWKRPVGYRRRLGEVPARSRSSLLCAEKAWRARRLHAVSSTVERNLDKAQYRGAIHLDLVGLIASFSGLPEEVDEAVMLVAAVLLGFITGGRVAEVLALSRNQTFEPLLALCQLELSVAA